MPVTRHSLNLYQYLFMYVLLLCLSIFVPAATAQNRDTASNEAHESTIVLEVPEHNPVSFVAWNDTGEILAAASTRTIFVWSLADAQLYRVFDAEGVIGNTLQWADQEHLHFSSQTRESTVFSVWNLTTNIIENISSIDVSGASAWNLSNGLVAAVADNRNAVYEVATGNNLYLGEELWSRLEVVDVAWSPAGDLLVWRYFPIRNLAGNLVVERFNSSELVPIIISNGFGSPECSSVAWSPASEIVACGQNDGEVLLLEVAAEFGESPQVLDGADGTIIDVEFSPDGTALATIDEQSYLTIWSTIASQVVWQVLQPHSQTLAWSGDSSRIAIGGSDGLIYILSPEI